MALDSIFTESLKHANTQAPGCGLCVNRQGFLPVMTGREYAAAIHPFRRWIQSLENYSWRRAIEKKATLLSIVHEMQRRLWGFPPTGRRIPTGKKQTRLHAMTRLRDGACGTPRSRWNVDAGEGGFSNMKGGKCDIGRDAVKRKKSCRFFTQNPADRD